MKGTSNEVYSLQSGARSYRTCQSIAYQAYQVFCYDGCAVVGYSRDMTCSILFISYYYFLGYENAGGKTFSNHKYKDQVTITQHNFLENYKPSIENKPT